MAKGSEHRKKTKVMKFNGNGHKCKTIFLYNDKPVESVSKYKYLGIEFSSSGSSCSAVSNISNRGMKAFFFLKGYFSGSINPGLGLKLFDLMMTYFMLWIRALECILWK